MYGTAWRHNEMDRGGESKDALILGGWSSIEGLPDAQAPITQADGELLRTRSLVGGAR